MTIQAMLERWRSKGGWCLVRWMSGYTAAQLRARKDPLCEVLGIDRTVDPETGASYCGPLSYKRIRDSGNGTLGFPENGDLGKVDVWKTEQEATDSAKCLGSAPPHISADIACPLSALHFSVREFNHYDGSSKVWYEGGDLFEARAVKAMRLFETSGEDGAQYLKLSIDCYPVWEKLGTHRPTAEQARVWFEWSEKVEHGRLEQMRERDKADGYV